MTYTKIINCIKKNEIKNIYLFYGEEVYLINNVLEKLKAKLVEPSFEQLNFVIIEGEEASYEKIIDACETLPFMAEKKLVYVKDLDIFRGKSKQFSEIEEKQFAEYISQIPKSTSLVFYGNTSIDGRKKIIKEIKKHGDLIEFTKLREDEFNKWIISAFKNFGKTIKPKELALLKNALDYLGRSPSQNLLDVENEIKKLISFMGERAELENEDINKVLGSSFQNDIFNLLDSIEKRNSVESIKRLNYILEEGEPILKILTTLGNQMKNILSSKLLVEEGYSSKMIASKLKIHPFVASKCARQSKNFTIGELINLLNKFLDADLKIKSGMMDEKLVMEMLVLEICK